MKKLSVVVQFLFFGGVVAAIIFFSIRPIPKPDYDPAQWHSWDGFFILSYITAAKDSGVDQISQKHLEVHLRALKEAGYHTVSPEDISKYLEGRSPLPEKALLLIFEGGSKDSYLYATPLLRKFGMMATMCVPTGMMQRWESFYLKDDDIRRLAGDANWRVCNMGENAIKTITAAASGGKGHYLVNRILLEGKQEGEEAFRRRVEDDYRRSAGLLEKLNGGKITAYLYPFADAGTGPNANPAAAELNRKLVSFYHRIAIALAENPFNDPKSDPYCLNRLRVPNSWDEARLLEELAAFTPRQAPVTGLGGETTWTRRGRVRFQNDAVTLSGNAGIWLRGSDEWSDIDLSAMIDLGNSAAVIYARYSGNNCFLRINLDRVSVNVLEKAGASSQTLFSGRIDTASPILKLRLKTRGNRAWLWLEEKLIAGPLPLSRLIKRGSIGISCGQGTIRLLNFKAGQLPYVYVLASNYEGLPASVKSEVGAVMPLLFSQTSAVINEELQLELLKIAADGVQMHPFITIRTPLTPQAADRLAERVTGAVRNSLISPLVRQFAIYGNDVELASSLRSRGYSVVRILSPAEAKEAARRKSGLDGDRILIDGPEKESAEAARALLFIVPPERLIMEYGLKGELPAGVNLAINGAKRLQNGR